MRGHFVQGCHLGLGTQLKPRASILHVRPMRKAPNCTVGTTILALLGRREGVESAVSWRNRGGLRGTEEQRGGAR